MKKKEILIILGRKFLIFIGGGIVFILLLAYGIVPAINFYYSLTERPLQKTSPSPQKISEEAKNEISVSVIQWPDFTKAPFIGGGPISARFKHRWAFLRNGQIGAVEEQNPYFLTASAKKIVYFHPSPTGQYIAYEVADSFSLDWSRSATEGLWVYDVLNKTHVNINMGRYDYYNNSPFSFTGWLPPFGNSKESLIATPHTALAAGPSSLFSPQGDIIVNGGLLPSSDLLYELSERSFSKDSAQYDRYYQACFKNGSLFLSNSSFLAIDFEFLKVTSGRITQVEWSPDGEKIAVVIAMTPGVQKPQRKSVWIADFSEKKLWKIKEFEEEDIYGSSLEWSPDSQRILYGLPQIDTYYVLNIQEPENILYESEGKKLTWYKNQKIFEERREANMQGAIYTVDLETKEEKLFLENACCIKPF